MSRKPACQNEQRTLIKPAFAKKASAGNGGETGTRTLATVTRRQISNLLRYHSGTSPKFLKIVYQNAVANVALHSELNNNFRMFF